MLIQDGWIPFHAVAFSFDGRGVAVIGKKFAGKTYTIFLLLENGKVNFVSNDKIFLKVFDNKIYIFTLFNEVGIRYGTIIELKQLVKYLKNNITYYENTNIEEIINKYKKFDKNKLRTIKNKYMFYLKR